VILGVFPLVAKKILDALKARKVYAKWPRPARFDRNVVVIGAGSAGLVTAYIAAAVKAKVTLVERHRWAATASTPGACPQRRSSRPRSCFTRSGTRRLWREERVGRVRLRRGDGAGEAVVATVEPHDSVERYSALGVECLKGSARITSPWTVEVDLAEGESARSPRRTS
jgi:pyruvate/2-oxoglutarate dehydrogenase complex dihydrolipoamide dehydrogenase (E3) component